MSDKCPFCSGGVRFFMEEGSAAALFDIFPVNKGHVLIVPKAHRRTLFDCSEDEVCDIWRLVQRVKEHLDGEFKPDGYNVGVNVEEVAGQTVFHCHVHVIPRYEGDCDEPRGGVRAVKPALVDY